MFFGCPSCGCAWSEPPTPHVVDTIDRPEVFAPEGFRLAAAADIAAAAMSGRVADDHAEATHVAFDDADASSDA